jgi:hypothetical protein
VLHKDWPGILYRLDRDEVYVSSRGVSAGARPVCTSFKRPQPVASFAQRVPFLFQFVLINPHFLSLPIDLFSHPALTQAGQEEVAERGGAARMTLLGALRDSFQGKT